ncbi:hypothetical protein R1X32_10165 (plasmid) [Rhodococcus opacus]|uniref:hypothetical protein n=1 Tax=Rhodococcus opacus TaxID=37919 RepID=UPI0034D391F9
MWVRRHPTPNRTRGRRTTFDTFECAVHAMAPCDLCGCRVLGHGVEAGDRIVCCTHCARESGHRDLVDRTDR